MWDPVLQQVLNRFLLQWNCEFQTTGKVGKSCTPIFLDLSIWYFAIWAYVSCFHNFHTPICANFCCLVAKLCPALCNHHGYIYIYIYIVRSIEPAVSIEISIPYYGVSLPHFTHFTPFWACEVGRSWSGGWGICGIFIFYLGRAQLLSVSATTLLFVLDIYSLYSTGDKHQLLSLAASISCLYVWKIVWALEAKKKRESMMSNIQGHWRILWKCTLIIYLVLILSTKSSEFT